MLFFEEWHKDFGYTHTAVLDNGVTVHAFEDGTAIGSDGNRYRIVTHLDEDDDVVVDGWELAEYTE